MCTGGERRGDLGHRRVAVVHQEVHRTPMEYTFCTVLVWDAGRVLTERHRVLEVRGPHQTSATHDVRISLDQRAHFRRNIRLCVTPCPTISCMGIKKRADSAYLI